jgi:hypothetical protein
LPVVYVDEPACGVGVVVGVVLGFVLLFNYIFSSVGFPLDCCNCVYTALSTMLSDNVEVALSLWRGVARFLGELQKTCAVCVILFQLITPDQ